MKKMKSWILALAVMAVVTTFAGSALAKTDAAQNDQQTTYAVAKAACQNSAMPATNQINLVSAVTAVDTSPAAKFAVMTTAVTTLENCTVVEAANVDSTMANAGAAAAQLTSGNGDFDVILPQMLNANFLVATQSTNAGEAHAGFTVMGGGVWNHAGCSLATAQNAMVAT